MYFDRSGLPTLFDLYLICRLRLVSFWHQLGAWIRLMPLIIENMAQLKEEMNLSKFSKPEVAENWPKMAISVSTYDTVAHLEPKCLLWLNKACPRPFQARDNRVFLQMISRLEQFDQ